MGPSTAENTAQSQTNPSFGTQARAQQQQQPQSHLGYDEVGSPPPPPPPPGPAAEPAAVEPAVVDFEPSDNTFATGSLEVDPDVTSSDFADDLVVDEEGDSSRDFQKYAQSVYAMSTYPKANRIYPIEEPYEDRTGRIYDSDHDPDDATIDSARTLYAEDVDYVMEHGRQYCGEYFMPVDQAEQTRQYVIHQVYLKLFNLELTTVPLENPRYILDVGTGIGEWAIGMAEKYPECEVFGTDIAPIQPTQQVPFNIEFHIEDAEEEWIRPANTVDLVYLRNLAGAFRDWRFVYQQAFNCIRPGGYIEILDFDNFNSNENFLSHFDESSPAHILIRGLDEAARVSGRPRGVEHMEPGILEEIGFSEIREATYDLGIGTRENSSYGRFWLFAVVTGMEGFSMRPLTRYLGWDERYVKELCDKVAISTKALAESPEREEGFVFKLRVMSARKPLSPRTTAGAATVAAAGAVSEATTPTPATAAMAMTAVAEQQQQQAPEVLPGHISAKALGEEGVIYDYSGDDSTIRSRSG